MLQKIQLCPLMSRLSHYSFLKGVPTLTQDLNFIENTVFSLDYVIFLLNYKVHRIGLFVE